MTRSQLPFVAFDGRELAGRERAMLIEAVVDDHMVLPDTFSLRFILDIDETYERLGVKIGGKVLIKSAELGESPDSNLIEGQITSIEAIYEEGAQYIVVRGYDQSHRLHAGRKTRSFNNQTDSDIVEKIAREAGITVSQVDRSDTVHDHIGQVNMTDWEFLRARAREIGFTVAVRDGELTFLRGGAAPGRIELTVGQELVTFRPRVTGAQQVKEVEARGWDYKTKKKVTHTAPADTESVSLDTSGWQPVPLATKVGAPKYLTCDRPIATAGEARIVAEAAAAEIASSFAEAEGTAIGNPGLTTGSLVTVVGGGPFDGDWKVSHTRHRFDQDGYYTDFEVAGWQERSVLGLTSFGASAEGARPVYGVVVGLVTNSNDPEGLGRVKLEFPWLSDDFETHWARVCFPGAGPERGMFLVPEVGDEVLVVFDHGDVRMPYVLGGLYNGRDAPPATGYCEGGDGRDGKIKVRTWKSTKGHEITMSDKDSEDRIVITTKNNEYSITISKADDQIEVKSKGKIVLDGPGGIEFKGGTGGVKVSGTSIELSADSNIELKGATAKLEGSGTAEIKGGVVKIN
ncbi:MAG: VgrG-related protein [Ilumatobacteraceae bacterium]